MNHLRQAMAAWQQAIEQRDSRAAGALMHADYQLVLIHPAVATMSRSQWLDMLNDYVIHEYQVEEQVDTVEGFAAVLSRVRMRATVLGQDRSGLFILSDSWIRTADGDWLVWRRHSSPLSAGEMPSGGGS